MTTSSATFLIKDATAPTVGPTAQIHTGQLSFDCKVEGTGTVTATVLVQVTNFPDDANSWKDWVTLTLSGTTSDYCKRVIWGPWKYMRGNVTAISGTNATVNLVFGNHAYGR